MKVKGIWCLSYRVLPRIFLISCGLLFLVVHSANARTDSGVNEIKAMVVNEALDLGLPVALALAVAHTESHFDARALSRKGARGVMQIMPATARGEYGLHADYLWIPKVNIRLGIHFLRRLIIRYHGRVDLALSYYNGGSAVGIPPHARVIPATRGYVERVKALQRFYKRKVWSGEYEKWKRKTQNGIHLVRD